MSTLGEEGLRRVRRRSPPSLVLTRQARSPRLAKPNCADQKHGPSHFSTLILTCPSLTHAAHVGHCCAPGESDEFAASLHGFLGRVCPVHTPVKLRDGRYTRRSRDSVPLQPPSLSLFLCSVVVLMTVPLSSTPCANQEDCVWGSSSAPAPCRRLGPVLHLGGARRPISAGPGLAQDLQRGAVPVDQQR